MDRPLVALGKPQRFLAVIGCQDRVALRLENVAGQEDDIGRVVCDEDRFHGVPFCRMAHESLRA
jgi:hypothetical protein